MKMDIFCEIYKYCVIIIFCIIVFILLWFPSFENFVVSFSTTNSFDSLCLLHIMRTSFDITAVSVLLVDTVSDGIRW